VIDFDPAEMTARDAYRLMIGIIVPRAIAFVSTLSAQGTLNLAPFSFFTAVGDAPPTICISMMYRDGEPKDSLRNIMDTGEFVVNSVSYAMRERMNLTSGEYGPDTDEFALAGLTPAPSLLVKPPRVAESSTSMECILQQVVTVGRAPRLSGLVIGEVVKFRISEDVYDNGRVDPHALDAIGRMAGDGYATTRELFDIKRPVVEGSKH
jgi:flavin reductase (DIM6/NTAB) family NADH-FMN oxidoreductase RutF